MRQICFFLLNLFLLAQVSCRVNTSAQKKGGEVFDTGHNGKGPALAVIGDSISSGVLASTRLGHDIDRQLLNRLTRFYFGPAHQLEKFAGEFSELSLSATTTDRNWGLRAAIARQYKTVAKEIPVFTAFKWGGKLEHMDGYLDYLKEEYRKRGAPANYVMFSVGGNDFCAGKNPEDFAKQYDKKLGQALDLHPKATVLVALLPRFSDITKYEHQYSRALSCEKFRKYYCKVVYFPDAHERSHAFNDVIRRIIYKKRLTYPGRLFLASKVDQLYISHDDLSFDCFHLSLSGQKKLAEIFTQTLEAELAGPFAGLPQKIGI